jgi:hypothetical protein
MKTIKRVSDKILIVLAVIIILIGDKVFGFSPFDN